jgi:hypothetical protein
MSCVNGKTSIEKQHEWISISKSAKNLPRHLEKRIVKTCDGCKMSFHDMCK